MHVHVLTKCFVCVVTYIYMYVLLRQPMSLTLVLTVKARARDRNFLYQIRELALLFNKLQFSFHNIDAYKNVCINQSICSTCFCLVTPFVVPYL